MLILGVVSSQTRFGTLIKNGSATLMEDDRVIASIAEERLTRKKNAAGCRRAVRHILTEELGSELPDYMVASTCCEPASAAHIDDFEMPLFLSRDVLRTPSHHLSHALSAYYTSPFERAIILVLDAGGNTLDSKHPHTCAPEEWWKMGREQFTCYLAEGKSLHIIRRYFDAPCEWGIGEVYRAFTQYLGFGGHTNSGKTMGLAAYGDSNCIKNKLFYRGNNGALESIIAFQDPDHTTSSIEKFLLDSGITLPPRSPDSELRLIHADVASFVQREIEESVAHVVQYLCKKYDVHDICLAGGVALNCPMNTRVQELDNVTNVHIPPCPGDDGQSFGNALYALSINGSKERPFVDLCNSFLGGHHEDQVDDILDSMKKGSSKLEVVDDDMDFGTSAQLIADGHIIAWYQGRAEIGPRALGHRSILADPRRTSVRVRLSQSIKEREAFRPYAASVIEDQARLWFDLPCRNPFMLYTGKMLSHTQRVAVALEHADHTCRVQTVTSEYGSFYRLLQSFEKKSGLPFLVNTSLNGPGEPLVETVQEAISLVLKSDIDGVVIGQKLLQRRRPPLQNVKISTPRLHFDAKDTSFLKEARLYYPSYPISERSYFGLLRQYCDWILSNKKCTTIRFTQGAVDLPSGRIMSIFARPGDEVVFAVEVTGFHIIPYGALTAQDAKRDGFTSLTRLREALRSFYGDLPDAHPVTIYDIRLVEGLNCFSGRKLAEQD
jgi:carbamoyltransferase